MQQRKTRSTYVPGEITLGQTTVGTNEDVRLCELPDGTWELRDMVFIRTDAYRPPEFTSVLRVSPEGIIALSDMLNEVRKALNNGGEGLPIRLSRNYEKGA